MGDKLFDKVYGEKAIFGMGCFWRAEASFGCLPEVLRVKAGYCGGKVKDPTYNRLGDFLEAIEVEYDPFETTYEDMLAHFWANHDYTASLKYHHRSTIFYSSHDQKDIAEKFVGKRLYEHSGRDKIMTQILPATEFYTAEDYHQKHALQQHPDITIPLKIPQNRYHHSHVATRLNGYVAGHGTLERFEVELEELGLSGEIEKLVRELIKQQSADEGAGRGGLLACASAKEMAEPEKASSPEFQSVKSVQEEEEDGDGGEDAE